MRYLFPACLVVLIGCMAAPTAVQNATKVNHENAETVCPFTVELVNSKISQIESDLIKIEKRISSADPNDIELIKALETQHSMLEDKKRDAKRIRTICEVWPILTKELHLWAIGNFEEAN